MAGVSHCTQVPDPGERQRWQSRNKKKTVKIFHPSFSFSYYTCILYYDLCDESEMCESKTTHNAVLKENITTKTFHLTLDM